VEGKAGEGPKWHTNGRNPMAWQLILRMNGRSRREDLGAGKDGVADAKLPGRCQAGRRSQKGTLKKRWRPRWIAKKGERCGITGLSS